MTEETNVSTELRDLGLTIETDESTAKKIKGELLVIEGRLHQGAYRDALTGRFADVFHRTSFVSTRKLYSAAFHAVAKQIVLATTALEVVTETIPTFLLNFSKARKWRPDAYDLRQMKLYIRGAMTEWEGKRLQMAALRPSKGTIDGALAAEFPKRAAWLKERLKERAWNENDVQRQRGPDRKTVQRILRGESVREDVLEKLVRALSTKKAKVDLLDIPSE